MSKSHFSEYIEEMGAKHVLENENGFVLYSFPIDSKDCYIEEIFTIPSKRNAHEATALADEVKKIAQQRGCNRLLGSVIPSANNSTRSLKVLLGYGMNLVSSSNNFILFSKNIV